MNIDLWQAVLAVAAGAVAAWIATRWWHVRQIQVLARRLHKLDDTHQASLRMMGQARKQIDELQRLVSEYRRRLTTFELQRRRSAMPKLHEVVPAANDAPAPAVTPLPVVRLQGGWADTQPM
ncbi:MAG TPA: hypothetical protein VF169_00175 [Albitalea sp.]|uniref:hypothetical protein n=1 Tax=Piscinibacter sp. TaxID=1903157 RepID=UPI002ED6A825